MAGLWVIAVVVLLVGLGLLINGVLEFREDELGAGVLSVVVATIVLVMSLWLIGGISQLSGFGRVAEDRKGTELSVGEVYEVMGTVNVSGVQPVHVLRRVSDGKLLAYLLRVPVVPRVFVRRSEQQAKEKIQELIKKLNNGKVPPSITVEDATYDDYLYGPVGPIE